MLHFMALVISHISYFMV